MLTEAREREQAENLRLTDLDRQLADVAYRAAPTEAALKAARGDEQAARIAYTTTEARHADAVGRRQRFDATADQPHCGVCGQPITAEHAANERARLDEEIATATRARDEKQQGLEQISNDRQAKESVYAALMEERDTLSQQQRQYERDRDDARAGIIRYAEQCGSAYGHLPEAHRAQVSAIIPVEPAAWTATVYPTRSDLDAMRREAGGRDEHRARLDTLQKGHKRLERLETRRQSALTRVEEIEKTYRRADLVSAREQQKSLTQRQDELTPSVDTLRSRLDQALGIATQRKQSAEKLHADLRYYQERAGHLRVRADEVVANRQPVQERLQEQWWALAASATVADISQWQAEQEALVEYPELSAELLRARERFESWARQETECCEEIARLPRAAHRPAVAIEGELVQAKECQEKVVERQLQRGVEFTRLTGQRGQWQELKTHHAEADRQRYLHQILATNLGRNGLQMFLLRRAETAVVEHANDILDRLAGGRMRLHLRNERDFQAEKALDLLFRDYDTGTKEIPIGLASGSQRFRIAVSLALAIGRYLGQESQRIQSVIIDEGFGSLDKVGRNTMIQELNQLQTELQRIILVSHQDEITEAFSNCYAVALLDGASRVSLTHVG